MPPRDTTTPTDPVAHLYILSDACPTDWLGSNDEEWHTIVNMVVQSQPGVDTGAASHLDVLGSDVPFTQFVAALGAGGLNSGLLKKWKTSPSYQASFRRAYSHVWPQHRPLVAALSFREGTLRASKQALLAGYNAHIGGVEGRGLGFEEYVRDGGRRMRHQFVNMSGWHQIDAPENQTLVLLLMAWFVADQYRFYHNHIVASQRHGFDELAVTVVSDKLSGDDDARPFSEARLRMLVNPDGEVRPRIRLTRSPESDTFPGDLLVDNLAGWLNCAMANRAGDCAEAARALHRQGAWVSWRVLSDSPHTLGFDDGTTLLNNA